MVDSRLVQLIVSPAQPVDAAKGWVRSKRFPSCVSITWSVCVNFASDPHADRSLCHRFRRYDDVRTTNTVENHQKFVSTLSRSVNDFRCNWFWSIDCTWSQPYEEYKNKRRDIMQFMLPGHQEYISSKQACQGVWVHYVDVAIVVRRLMGDTAAEPIVKPWFATSQASISFASRLLVFCRRYFGFCDHSLVFDRSPLYRVLWCAHVVPIAHFRFSTTVSSSVMASF